MPRTKQFDEQEVLKKAMELFWEKGFHATSMQDLVDYLGINRASIYDTYGGKNSLFDKAFQNYRKMGSESVRTIFEAEPNVKKGFTKLFNTAIEEARTDTCKKGCFVVNTITELVPGDETLHKKLQQHTANTQHIFAEYIRKGIAAGTVKTSKDPETIAFTLFTLFSGLRVMAKVEENPKKLQEMIAIGLSVLD